MKNCLILQCKGCVIYLQKKKINGKEINFRLLAPLLPFAGICRGGISLSAVHDISHSRADRHLPGEGVGHHLIPLSTDHHTIFKRAGRPVRFFVSKIDRKSPTCKPDSVQPIWPRSSFICPAGCPTGSICLPFPVFPKETMDEPSMSRRRGVRTRDIHGISARKVYPPQPSLIAAVGSYPTFSPLPR